MKKLVLFLDLTGGCRRVSVANSDLAEAVAISANELLINGKQSGDTSLFIWDLRGARREYTVHVLEDGTILDSIQKQLAQEVGPDVTLTMSGSSVFIRGTVQTTTEADRAAAIAAAYPKSKVVNLLRVAVPAAQPQILLKVRFADVDRSLSNQIGVNLFALNNKGIATSNTGQFGGPPQLTGIGTPGLTATLTNLLNIMYYRPDINLGAVLQDLEAKNVLQILAEPNLLTLSGHPASFLAGGEFPFPTIQGGASGVGQITIQFKEFGIRLNFIPTVTPRGTIHLTVMPEVSALDYTNGLTVSGYTVPGLATKRVTTDVELENGQSFAIAGLLNNELTETFDHLPGLASIPVLGNLFKSRGISKTHSELLVIVTPELVKPLAPSDKELSLPMPYEFLPGGIPKHLKDPEDDKPVDRPTALPVEEVKALADAEAGTAPSASPVNGLAPAAGPSAAPSAAPAASPGLPPNK